MKFGTMFLGAAVLAVATSAQAGIYLGHFTSPGVARATTAIAQTTNSTHLRTAYLQVNYTDGSVTYPEFTASSASTVVTTTGAGGCRTDIQMRVLSGTKTLVTVTQYGDTTRPGVKSITFGTPNSRVIYDIKADAAHTPGSDLGLVPFASTTDGAWSAQLEFTNPIALVGAAPRGDVFNTMRVNCPNPIYAGTFAFTVDTDALP